MPMVGIDFSESYIRHARRHLKRWSRIHLAVADGEAIPACENSFDAATSVFVVHELPPSVRAAIFREAARVLKPGGRLVLVDSLQLGDVPAYDEMLRRFPEFYHEPYFRSYLIEEFSALATLHGFAPRQSRSAYVSKVMIFDKQ
jgi:ubiquinone/menaquinone biosynthesis C-methylase UbiE